MIIRVGIPAYHPRVVLQRAGYTEFIDPNTRETSYVRRLRTDFYPRFHLYVSEERGQLKLSLHLDQKKPSYGGGTRKHSGEYDGPTVEVEAGRIYSFFQ